MPVEVELSGTFMQIKRFFASLVQRDVRLPGSALTESGGEAPERIVSIEDLSLSNPTVANREIVLTAKFTAVTFRQADKPTPPATPGATPGAPGGAAKPAGDPPLAPAASPRPTTAPASSAAAPGTPPLPPTSAPATPPPLPSAVTPAGAKAAPATGSDRLKGGL